MRRWMKGCWLLIAATSVLATQAAAELAPPTTPSLAIPTTAEDFEGALADLDREERGLVQKLGRATARYEQLQTQNVVRGRAYVRLARAGLLPVGGGFEGLVDHATHIERLRRALVRDLAAQQELFKAKQDLSRELADVRARREPLERERLSLARSHEAIAAAQDREEAFRRAFDTEANPHTAIYGANVDPTSLPKAAEGLAAIKGRLPFPIAGRAEVRHVGRSSRRGPGLEMLARVGTPVLAVYAGRVAFADSYSDYGRTVIIDHGGDYFSVSANLNDVAVRVGQDIEVGEKIGTVGPAGDSGILYFELRRNGEAYEPSEWFGI
jgi:murein DD-endopeptidase MepM/ murein hydrolase activator NlpD